MIKRIIPLIAIALLFTFEGKSQSNWEAGVRFGDNFSADLTIPAGIAPRVHTAVYFDRFGIAPYFDWMFELSSGPNGLKFYPGVGPEFYFENRFDFGVGGDFGVEYQFDFPITVGFDWRPTFIMTNNADFYTGNWGFSARFRFGEGTSFKKSN